VPSSCSILSAIAFGESEHHGRRMPTRQQVRRADVSLETICEANATTRGVIPAASIMCVFSFIRVSLL